MADANEIWTRFRGRPHNAARHPGRDDIQKMIDDLTELQAIEGGGQPLSRFFQSVGTGMVEAQNALDIQVRKYNDGAPIQPKTFHVSRTKAKIKFGITSISSSGFNIIFASDKEETKRAEDQEVEFDIVTAPPPPDADLTPPGLGEFLELDPARRKEAISKARGASGDFANINQKTMLVFRDEAGLLVIRVEVVNKIDVRMIHAVRVGADGTVMAEPSREPAVPALARLLVRLVKWQSRIL